MSERLQVTDLEPRIMTVEETLTRGVETVLPNRAGLEAEMRKRSIRLYLGIDPTSPELHIGHTVPLRKLRQFQDLGHEVILLFGTFTGKIGDPSDKKAARVRLTDEQIARNMTTYKEQASRILDFKKVKIVQNHEWLGKLTLEEVIDIQANFTVQQMLERKMFQQRVADKKPIWLQEFSYPWMQGWDAVVLDVDLEVGGGDQLFNMLVGQTLVRRYKEHEKWVMGTRLIEDPSGKKMGKTEGNIVNIHDLPEVKFEGLMTWPDTAIPTGLELITSVPVETIDEASRQLAGGLINPMEVKETFAWRAVAELDGKEAADYAQEEFTRVKREGKLPRRIQLLTVQGHQKLSVVLIKAGFATSPKDSAGKIASGSVMVDGKVVQKDIPLHQNETLVQIGKRTIKNIRKVTSI